MAHIPLTNLLPEVLLSVSGCSNILATGAIRDAATRFLSLSLFWNEIQEAIEVTADDLPLPIYAPKGARVASVLVVSANGIALKPMSSEDVDSMVTRGCIQTASQPYRYYMSGMDDIELFPPFDSTVRLQIRVAYTLKKDAESIPSDLYEEYGIAIASGALGKLLAIPGQPWTNAALSETHRVWFETAIREAEERVKKGLTSADVRVRMRPLA